MIRPWRDLGAACGVLGLFAADPWGRHLFVVDVGARGQPLRLRWCFAPGARRGLAEALAERERAAEAAP